MKYVRLGKSGLKVSTVCLGTWHLPVSKERDSYGVFKVDVVQSKRVIGKAIDLGINFIDTANRYHGVLNDEDPEHAGTAEKILGQTIRGYDRESLVISTKVRGMVAYHENGEGLSRKHIMWQIRESLRRLNTDYVDIYLMHWPDVETPLEESLDAMIDLVKMGKVNYVGASNFHPEDIDFMVNYVRRAGAPFNVIQDQYSILRRGLETDKVPLAKRLGLGIMAFSPLAQGFLTGKYLDGIPQMSRASYVEKMKEWYFTEENIKFLREFHEIAKENGLKDSQLALSWVVKTGEVLGVSMIPTISVTSVEQLEENIEGVEYSMSNDVYRRLNELSRNFLNRRSEPPKTTRL